MFDVLGRLDRHDVDRALGAAVSVLRVGPAARSPMMNKALRGLGVLAQPPESHPESARLDRMPWGAGRFPSPPPSPPRGFDGPWPQAPEVDPGFYPPVLNLGDEERAEHFKYNAARYLGQIVRLTPGAALRARSSGRLSALDDATFTAHLTDTCFGQFVRLGLDPRDHHDFADVLRERSPEHLARVDLSVVPTEHLLPGIYAAPCVVLLAREGSRYRTLAIRVGARVVRPHEAGAWELARYFALQAAQARLVHATHPRLHFGCDPLNAITHSMLPRGHVVYRLLAPHMRFTLGLHEAVIHHRRSVLHSSPREIYSMFPFTTEGVHKMVRAGKRGIEENPAWPAYRFDDGLIGDHVPYGCYRRAWFESIYEMVSAVVSQVPPNDPMVLAWAEHVHPWIPGFPSASEIFRDDHLARALTRYIATVSVYHTGDHHSYTRIPIESIPWRLRMPMPEGALATLDLDALVSPEDHFRHVLGRAMFFEPVVITSLDSVRYGFTAPRARDAITRYRDRSAALDARWAPEGFPTARQIAASLQY